MVPSKKSNKTNLILLLGTAIILQSVFVTNAAAVPGVKSDEIQHNQYAFSKSGSDSVAAPILAEESSSTKQGKGSAKAPKNDNKGINDADMKKKTKNKDSKVDNKNTNNTNNNNKDNNNNNKDNKDNKESKDMKKQVEKEIEIVKSDIEQMDEDMDVADMIEDFEKSHDLNLDGMDSQVDGYMKSLWDNIVQIKDDPRVKSKIATLTSDADIKDKLAELGQDPSIQAGISAVTEKAKEFKYTKRNLLAQQDGAFQGQAVGIERGSAVGKNPKDSKQSKIINPEPHNDPHSATAPKPDLPKSASGPKTDIKGSKVASPPQAQKIPPTKAIAKDAPVAVPATGNKVPSLNDKAGNVEDDNDENDEEDDDDDDDTEENEKDAEKDAAPVVGKGIVKPQVPAPKKGAVLGKRQVIPVVVNNGVKQEPPKVAPAPKVVVVPQPVPKVNVVPLIPITKPPPKGFPPLPAKEPKPINAPEVEIKENKQEQKNGGLEQEQEVREQPNPNKHVEEKKHNAPHDDFIEVKNDNEDIEEEDDFLPEEVENQDRKHKEKKLKNVKNDIPQEEEFNDVKPEAEDKGAINGVWEAVFGNGDDEKDQVVEVQKKKHKTEHKHKQNNPEVAATSQPPTAPAAAVPAAAVPAPAPDTSMPQPAQGHVPQASQAPQGQAPPTLQKGAVPDAVPKGAAPQGGAPGGSSPATAAPAGAGKDGYGTVPMFGPAQLDFGSGASGVRAALSTSAWTSSVVAGVTVAVVALMNL